MKVIPVQSLKGGTGKTQICVGLGRALRKMGYSVGFLDVDWVAPNLHLMLGMNDDLELKLSEEVGDKIYPIFSPEGFPVLSSNFIFPSDQAICMDEESTIRDIKEITDSEAVDWGGVDYLIMDTPPTTSKFISAALSVEGLHGVVLVVQPAVSALADLLRTLSLIQDQQVPVLGLIGNQVYITCPHGEKIDLFELSEQDIVHFCSEHGVPYLGSVPHVRPMNGAFTGEMPDMDVIARRIVDSPPIYLKKDIYGALGYKVVLALAKKFKQAHERRSANAQD